MSFKGYRITSNYGSRIHPISGKRSFHAGIDLVKAHRTVIGSLTSGQVVYAGFGRSGTGLGGYGNVVLVRDGKGRGHLYAHLDSTLVKNGQTVAVGTPLGRQGATGNVTGSHLHYEIRKTTAGSYGWRKNKSTSTLDPVKFHQETGGKKRVVKKLTVDGYEGKNTVSREQQFYGTPIDGKLSKPSMVVKARQRFLNKYGGANLKVDGYAGKETVKAEQRFHGTPVDGKLSTPSMVVKARQRFLNSYGQ